MMELDILPPKVERTEEWIWDCPLCDFVGRWKLENGAVRGVRNHITEFHKITKTDVLPVGFIE